MNSTFNITSPELVYFQTTLIKARNNSSAQTQEPQRSFKCPNYLKLTHYESLLNEHQKISKHRDTKIWKYTSIVDQQTEELDLRLPTNWNPKDKSKNIDISSNGLDLLYVDRIGSRKQEAHAALARANAPMRHQCGVYYFEIKVISKGEEGLIGIGFSYAESSLQKLPGWDNASWGYHGHNGRSFAGSEIGQNYGPCFTTGDVVGCGVDFANQLVFYTKNGQFLGIAFKEIDFNKPVYPAIGLLTPGEEIRANFGQESFVYDIEQYIRDKKRLVIREILSNEAVDDNNRVQVKENLDQLALSYLVHHDYTKTASLFVKNAGNMPALFDNHRSFNISETNMDHRSSIRTALNRGQINEAIRLIEKAYPTLLERDDRGSSTKMMLECGKFIEMVRDYCDSMQENTSINNSKESSLSQSESTDQSAYYAETTCYPSPISIMDTTECKSNKITKSECHKITADKGNSAKYLEKIMKYGQLIHQEHKHDPSQKTRECLMEISCLLAYHNPYDSPVSHIMSTARRDNLATEVNGAILGK
ncbi:hypothetical protein G6F43_011730 [Rhizopus delemar]|nr:hypothetical protein G6F43_011730 [Rhizopus delemar]